MLHAREFKLYTGGKWRTFANPSEDLREELTSVRNFLLEKFPSLKGPYRKDQSNQDSHDFLNFHFVYSLDVRQALLSGNVVLICLYLMIIYPKIIPMVPRILKIYFAPIYDHRGNEVRGRKNHLKAGFKTSAPLLELTFLPWLKFFNRYLGRSRVFVDDGIFFSNKKWNLIIFTWFLKCFFRILGFSFHKIESYDLRSRPQKCGSRLGLMYGFNSKGNLVVKIRTRTLSRYLRRVELSLRLNTKKQVLRRISRILYSSEFYPLYTSFDKRMWTSSIQRRQFFGRCCYLIQRRFPELRSFSKKEIADLLWAHRVISLPSHLSLKSGCGNQIGLQ
jgi:hypothetical protein